MVRRIKHRTKLADDYKVLIELQDAAEWAGRRVYNSENGPDLLITMGEEVALAARTRTLDLAGEDVLVNALLGIKQLWLKLPSDSIFTPMVAADSNSMQFIRNDSELDSDTSVVAQGHPVYYDVLNFSQVRFAPALPASSKIRVDYYTSTAFNEVSGEASVALPEIFHQAILAKATAQVYEDLDDSRAMVWEGRALSMLQDALYVANRRVQAPVTTTPFRARRRRYI